MKRLWNNYPPPDACALNFPKTSPPSLIVKDDSSSLESVSRKHYENASAKNKNTKDFSLFNIIFPPSIMLISMIYSKLNYSKELPYFKARAGFFSAKSSHFQKKGKNRIIVYQYEICIFFYDFCIGFNASLFSYF